MSVSKDIVTHESQDAIAAMYAEQAQKARLSSSFVVSGLPNENNKPDSELVESLCSVELGISIQVTKCKRVGREVPNKPRKIVVFTRSEQQAQAVIKSAKTLRSSHNQTVRYFVFINSNLTKAEAQAQYELRKRKRQRKQELHHKTEAVSNANSASDELRVDTANDGRQPHSS